MRESIDGTTGAGRESFDGIVKIEGLIRTPTSNPNPNPHHHPISTPGMPHRTSVEGNFIGRGSLDYGYRGSLDMHMRGSLDNRLK